MKEVIINFTISEPARKDTSFRLFFFTKRKGRTIAEVQLTHVGDLQAMRDKLDAAIRDWAKSPYLRD